MPDLNTLAEFMLENEQWEQAGRPLDDLLNALLPALRRALPTVQALGFYTYDFARLQRTSSTANALDTLPETIDPTTPAFAAALAAAGPVWAEDYGWLVALRRDYFPYAVLIILTDDTTADAALLGLYSAQLQQTLANRFSRELIQRQNNITAALKDCENFQAVAEVLSRYLLKGGQFIAIHLLQRDTAGHLTGLRTIATANRKQAFALDHLLPVNDDDIVGELKQVFENGERLFLYDVQASPEVREKFKTWNEGSSIKTSCVLPMRSEGVVFGLINLNSVESISYTSEQEMQLLQSLADYVGSLVQLHNMTQETEFSQNISERQRLAFNELLAGQDFPVMAQIIARYMLPQKGRFLVINELVRDEKAQIVDWRVLSTANRHQGYQINASSDVRWEDMSIQVRNTIYDLEPMIVSDVAMADPERLGQRFYDWLREQSITSYMSVPVLLEDDPIAALIVLSREKHEFNREEINAFQNIAGQMGALIYVRRLQQETETARKLIDDLLLANRMITTSSEAGFMANAVMYTLSKEMIAAAITLFDAPDKPKGALKTHRLVALSTSTSVIPVDVPRMVLMPSTNEIITLKSGLPVTFEGDDLERLIPEDIQAQLGDVTVRWLVMFGLRSGDELLGTLTLVDDKSYAFNEDTISAYTSLADQIGTVLQGKALNASAAQARATANRLLTTTRSVAQSRTYEDLCASILAAMPENITTAAIILFDRPATPESPPGEAYVEIIATRTEVIRPQARDVIIADDERTLRGIAALLSGEPMLIEDSRQQSFMMANCVNALNAQGVYSFISIGLRSGETLIGLLDVGASERFDLQGEQLESVLVVADQAGVVLENQQLLINTENNLEEVQTLYALNQELLAATSALGVLRALRKYLAQDSASIVLVSFEWDSLSEDLTSLVVEAWLRERDEASAEPRNQLLDNLTPEAVEDLKKEWALQGREIDIIEDLEALLDERPALKHSTDSGVYSSVVIPIYDEENIVYQVTITYNEARTYSPIKRRLFNAAQSQIGIVLENQRLLRDMRTAAASLGNQVRILQTINHLSVSLMSTQNEQTLLDETAEAIINALRVDHVAIVLADPGGTIGKITSEYPERGLLAMEIERLPNKDDQQEMRQPRLIEDLTADEWLAAGWHKLMEKIAARSILLLPLFDVRSGYFGVISLHITTEGRTFTPTMYDTGRTMAAQIAVALQSIRLLRNTQRQAQQLEQIAGFSEAIQATLNTRELLEIALVSVRQIVVAQHISIAFYDTAHTELQLVARLDEDGESYVDLENGKPLTGEMITMHHVWTTRLPLQINDLQTEPTLRHHSRDDLRALMTLPIFSRGTARGVIEVGSTQSGAYTPVDGAVFQQLVSQFAVAADNAEAYTQTQRLARSKALANDISTRLQQQLTVNQMMQVTLAELGKALGAKRARIRLDPAALQTNGTDTHDNEGAE